MTVKKMTNEAMIVCVMDVDNCELAIEILL